MKLVLKMKYFKYQMHSLIAFDFGWAMGPIHIHASYSKQQFAIKKKKVSVENLDVPL